MSFPQFALLTGTIDGVNTVFTTPVPYTAGTVAVYLNGQLLLDPAGNPWAETTPATGTITITAAECIPRPGDHIAAFFLDTATDPLQIEITPISGSLVAEEPVSGQLAVETPLAGSLVQSEPLCGTLTDTEVVLGSVVDEEPVSGLIEDC